VDAEWKVIRFGLKVVEDRSQIRRLVENRCFITWKANDYGNIQSGNMSSLKT
jgi:hypothetical protein